MFPMWYERTNFHDSVTIFWEAITHWGFLQPLLDPTRGWSGKAGWARIHYYLYDMKLFLLTEIYDWAWPNNYEKRLERWGSGQECTSGHLVSCGEVNLHRDLLLIFSYLGWGMSFSFVFHNTLVTSGAKTVSVIRVLFQ